MIVGSESSRFWVIKLNRTTDAAGLVQVAPEITFSTEAWDQEVLNANGDNKASVESSVAVYEDIVYFGTTAGLILGRSEEHTSELQSLMRISYAVFCLKK